VRRAWARDKSTAGKSTGEIQLQPDFGVRWHSEAATALWISLANPNFKFAITENPARRRRFALAGALQKKENQCQES
jgi:hypothetical protein